MEELPNGRLVLLQKKCLWQVSILIEPSTRLAISGVCATVCYYVLPVHQFEWQQMRPNESSVEESSMDQGNW